MQCPNCQGNKGGMALVMLVGKGCVEMWMPCSLCRGTGEIPETQVSWITRGQAMRENRVGRRMSLREEAASLGISPVELSHMEQGKVAPIDYNAERERLTKMITEGPPEASR